MLLVVLVMLHSLAAIVWMGLSLRLQYQARLAADGAVSASAYGDAPAAAAAVPAGVASAGGQTVTGMTVIAVLFYAFAVGAFFVGGGFAGYSPVYHVALTLGLAFVLVQVLLVQPAWARLAGGEGSARKRLAMGLGVGHALWLVLFVLMFFGRHWGAVWAA